MRIKRCMMGAPLALALLALASTGCVPSLQPLIDDDKATFEPALVGAWVGLEEGTWRRLAPGEASAEDASGDERWIVERRGESSDYDVTIIETDSDEPVRFSARTARFSTGLYIELKPVPRRGEADDSFTNLHFVRASTFYRIELRGDTLEHFVLDPSWLGERFESRRLRLPHVMVDDELVLTASTKQLQRFIERHGNDQGAFVALGDALP